MESTNKDMVLVEAFYKVGRRTRRVYSWIARPGNPCDDTLFEQIERAVEKEFKCGVTYEQLSFRLTEIH